MGLTYTELFERFTHRAGFVSELHTRDGTKSLYKAETMNGTIYADDTFALRLAYEKAHFICPNGLYWFGEWEYLKSLESENVKC